MNTESVVARLAPPLYNAKGWIKLVGIISIIQGVLSILSIWGILICWIPIWMGVLLCSASNQLGIAFNTNDENAFRTSMEKLGTYFKIFGIFIIVMLVLGVIGILAAIIIPLVASMQH